MEQGWKPVVATRMPGASLNKQGFPGLMLSATFYPPPALERTPETALETSPETAPRTPPHTTPQRFESERIGYTLFDSLDNCFDTWACLLNTWACLLDTFGRPVAITRLRLIQA
jgi:hypothetical protein